MTEPNTSRAQSIIDRLSEMIDLERIDAKKADEILQQLALDPELAKPTTFFWVPTEPRVLGMTSFDQTRVSMHLNHLPEEVAAEILAVVRRHQK